MLRWLGFPSTMELQQELMAEVDIDRSGFLDFDEFLKVMRKYRDTELKTVRKAYEGEEEGHCLSLIQVHKIIESLNYYMPGKAAEERFDREFGLKEFEASDCISYIKQFRNMAREEFNKNHGFLNDELKKLKE